MTFREAQLSLQLMAEEKVGAPQRLAVLRELAREQKVAEGQAAVIGALQQESTGAVS